MSSPQAVGYSGLGATAVGGLTGAIGGIFSGQAQEQMFNYQAGVANLNAQISQQNAQYATNVGELQATKYGLGAAQRMGQIKVAQAAHGFDINTGSAKQVQESQTTLERNDQAAIRSDAAKTAYNYEVQATQFGAQAQLDTVAGKNAAAAGMISAGSSILGSAGAVDSSWLRGSQLGLWGGGGGSQALGG